ncbi:MAG: hypothetical protein Q7S00_00310, partial [bacterium]|nr:hypothetical protein [bacterium]
MNLKTAEQLFADSDNPAYRIDLGMLHFLQHETFLGHILMRCILVENPSIDTMGVTVQHARMYLYYAPEFVQKMNWKNMLAVLEHEVLHLLHLHITRCKNRHPRLWNVAADLAINPLIRQDYELPSCACFKKANGKPDEKIPCPENKDGGHRGPLLPPKKWLKHNAEYIYDELLKNAKVCQQCGGTGQIQKPQQGQKQDGKGQEKGEGQGQEKKEGEGNGQP